MLNVPLACHARRATIGHALAFLLMTAERMALSTAERLTSLPDIVVDEMGLLREG